MSVSEREQAVAYSSRAANDDHDSCEATESIEDASRDITKQKADSFVKQNKNEFST
jgi:hypothetical protein